MTNNLRPAIVLMVLFTVLTGIIYPLAITGVAAIAMPGQAQGSLIRNGDTIIGSSLIGQDFRSDRYFWPRPSATAENPYNAGASSGTNLGPTSAKLKDMVAAEVKRQRDTGITGNLPADAVTASGSGLDPDISSAYAKLQVARVAKARSLAVGNVEAILARQTETPFLGIFGEERVNVLALNLALDSVKP